MTPRLIAGLLAFGLATTGAVVATLVVSVMIEEINRKKPDGEQISDLGSTPFKIWRIHGESVDSVQPADCMSTTGR
jgi:hypothetical protein